MTSVQVSVIGGTDSVAGSIEPVRRYQEGMTQGPGLRKQNEALTLSLRAPALTRFAVYDSLCFIKFAAFLSVARSAFPTPQLKTLGTRFATILVSSICWFSILVELANSFF